MVFNNVIQIHLEFHKMKAIILFLLLVFTSFPLISKAQYVGSDLSYLHLGGDYYAFKFNVLYDCDNLSPAPSFHLLYASCLTDSSKTFIDTLRLDTAMTTNAVPLQFGVSSCDGGTGYGAKSYFYIGYSYILSGKWKFNVHGNSRNQISTISNSSQQGWSNEAYLNKLNFTYNSTFYFNMPPLLLAINGSYYCFNQGGIDSEGDSLVFSFSNPTNEAGINLNYIIPYSSSQFANSATPISLDSISGDLCLTSINPMVSQFGVKVEEYRYLNGVATKIGESNRDIQFSSFTLPENHPSKLSGFNMAMNHQLNTTDTNYQIDVPMGQAVNFEINTLDTDTFNSMFPMSHPEKLHLYWNHAITDMTVNFVGNGTSNPYGEFSWTPSQSDVDTIPHCFTVTLIDKTCPYASSLTRPYCIRVTQGISVEENANNTDFEISPNPTSGRVFIKTERPQYLKIYNLLGELVFETTIESSIFAELAPLQTGIYLMEMSDENGHRNRVKLVKK